MELITLNNRDEVFDWINRNHKELEGTSYLQELKTINSYSIHIAGGSDNRHVTKNISFPASCETYPVKFRVYASQFAKIQSVENTWFIKMVFRELLKGGRI